MDNINLLTNMRKLIDDAAVLGEGYAHVPDNEKDSQIWQNLLNNLIETIDEIDFFLSKEKNQS